MSFVYSVVARGTTPLAEFSSFQGNFKSIALKFLESIDPKDERTSTDQGEYIFFAKTDKDRMVYLCLTAKTIPAALRISFCDDLENKWRSKFGKLKEFTSYGQNKEFAPAIEALFNVYNSERAQKIGRIRDNIYSAQEETTKNITLALQRGEQLQVMAEKADSIKESATVFTREAKKTKRMMLWQKIRWYIFGAGAGLAVLLLIILIIAI